MSGRWCGVTSVQQCTDAGGQPAKLRRLVMREEDWTDCGREVINVMYRVEKNTSHDRPLNYSDKQTDRRTQTRSSGPADPARLVTPLMA